MHLRYEVDHDFLTPQLGWEVVTISRLVNAFFRWEFNSCETIVKDDVAAPIDYANASPDVALTSLHYYFPWAIKTLVKWTVFCTATARPMRINQNTRDYFEIGDREDLSYDDKLREYRRLADEYFQTDAYEEFCARARGGFDELALEYFGGASSTSCSSRPYARPSRSTSTRRWSPGTAVSSAPGSPTRRRRAPA